MGQRTLSISLEQAGLSWSSQVFRTSAIWASHLTSLSLIITAIIPSALLRNSEGDGQPTAAWKCGGRVDLSVPSKLGLKS